MKALILLSILFSFSSFAKTTCSKAFNDKELWNVEKEKKTYKIVFTDTIKFPEAKMKEAGQFFSEDGGCQEARLAVVKHKPSKTTFKLVYTVDDSCDGGNSFGYITDKKDNIVGLINDSFIECN